MPTPITIIQGAQYGSEAKGAIAAHLCLRENVDVAVRTGATNAGHTIIYKGEVCKMQQLPVGWVNPDTDLVLGAGALIDPHILSRECSMVTNLTGKDVRTRLMIDYRAGVHLPVHQERSKASGRHHKIGATGKGSSEALIDKIRLRGDGYRVFGESQYAEGYKVIDTAKALNDIYDGNGRIMLEGTQGTLLDLHLGPYPYTTHKQTTPAVWMAECGLSPALKTDIVMVARTYPIRVAGNSGPMPNEISWPHLAKYINQKRKEAGVDPLIAESAILEFNAAVEKAAARYNLPSYSDGTDQHMWNTNERLIHQMALSEINADAIKLLPPATLTQLMVLFEMTTVTRKLRRVANMSWTQLLRAAKLCRPHRVALTFMNYEFPEYWYRIAPFTPPIASYVARAESVCGAPVDMATWGPGDEHIQHYHGS